jgi:hypothetical protein
MKYEFTIQGRLPSLNEINSANRSHWGAGSRQKQKTDWLIMAQIPRCLKYLNLTNVTVTFTWFDIHRRRDPDNVYSAQKFLLDSLVKTKVLQGDGQKHVKRIFHSEIFVDKKNPRVEIVLEVENE